MLTSAELTRFCLARDRLREVREDSLSVQAIAQEARVSLFHFIRRFEAVFGETPHQFRIRARIERACELLASGDSSVTDVCMQVGCSSLGSFSRLFTERVGMTPSAWRRQARRGPAPGCLTLMCGPAAFAIFEKQPDSSIGRLGS
jgi:AraC-like DNA-binding protein